MLVHKTYNNTPLTVDLAQGIIKERSANLKLLNNKIIATATM